MLYFAYRLKLIKICRKSIDWEEEKVHCCNYSVGKTLLLKGRLLFYINFVSQQGLEFFLTFNKALSFVFSSIQSLHSLLWDVLFPKMTQMWFSNQAKRLMFSLSLAVFKGVMSRIFCRSILCLSHNLLLLLIHKMLLYS